MEKIGQSQGRSKKFRQDEARLFGEHAVSEGLGSYPKGCTRKSPNMKSPQGLVNFVRQLVSTNNCLSRGFRPRHNRTMHPTELGISLQ